MLSLTCASTHVAAGARPRHDAVETSLYSEDDLLASTRPAAWRSDYALPDCNAGETAPIGR